MRCWKLRLSQNHRAGRSSRGHLVHPVTIQNSIQERKVFIFFLRIFSINSIGASSEIAFFCLFFVFKKYFISGGILRNYVRGYILEISELQWVGQHLWVLYSKEATLTSGKMEKPIKKGGPGGLREYRFKPSITRMKSQEYGEWINATLIAEEKKWAILERL